MTCIKARNYQPIPNFEHKEADYLEVAAADAIAMSTICLFNSSLRLEAYMLIFTSETE